MHAFPLDEVSRPWMLDLLNTECIFGSVVVVVVVVAMRSDGLMTMDR